MWERQEMVRALKDVPCADCGGSYPPFVMDFDHRLGTAKLGGVSDMIFKDRGWEGIQVEISKCDVVCANCHRMRTHARSLLR